MKFSPQIMLGVLGIFVTVLLAAAVALQNGTNSRLDRIENRIEDRQNRDAEFRENMVERVSQLEVIVGVSDGRYYRNE